jgi:hypothetical protein
MTCHCGGVKNLGPTKTGVDIGLVTEELLGDKNQGDCGYITGQEF